MNRGNKRVFDGIKNAVLKFQSTMQDSLETYHTSLDRFQTSHRKSDYTSAAWDRILKEEKGRLAADVRSRTAAAQRQLSGAIAEQIPALKTELLNELKTTPNTFFTDQLRNYSSLKIKPSEIEIEALLEQNAGVLSGLRFLNACLESVGSSFRVSGSTPDDFEKDLTTLEKFASQSQLFVPDSLFHDGIEVFTGQKRDAIGNVWDATGLILASAFVRGFLKDLDAMTGRWTGEILPSLAQLDEYQDGENGTAQEQYDADRQQIANHAEVQLDSEAAAKAKAAELAQSERAYAAVMGHYRR